MPPPLTFTIRGTVYSTLAKGRSEVRVTINTSKPGIKQDIYIGGVTHLEKGLTLDIINLTTKEKTTTTTSTTSGKYLFECRNLIQGYSNEDVILIIASNVVDTGHSSSDGDDQVENDIRINARRRILVDRDGNEITPDNPLPVVLAPSDDLNFANAKLVITRGANRRISQKDWYYKGRHWKQTITYGTNTDTHNAIVEV